MVRVVAGSFHARFSRIHLRRRPDRSGTERAIAQKYRIATGTLKKLGLSQRSNRRNWPKIDDRSSSWSSSRSDRSTSLPKPALFFKPDFSPGRSPERLQQTVDCVSSLVSAVLSPLLFKLDLYPHPPTQRACIEEQQHSQRRAGIQHSHPNTLHEHITNNPTRPV